MEPVDEWRVPDVSWEKLRAQAVQRVETNGREEIEDAGENGIAETAANGPDQASSSSRSDHTENCGQVPPI